MRALFSLLAMLVCMAPAEVWAACGMGNQCAVVEGLTLSPAQPMGGQMAKLSCAASDPDGTVVQLRFSASGGVFSNNQTSILATMANPAQLVLKEVVWTPPPGSGQTFQLTCQPVDNGGLMGTPAPGNAAAISVTTGAATQPPVIESLIASVEVFPSGSTPLVVKATDPLGGTLSYSWTATAGTISGDKDADPENVTWTAPATLGSATVTVDVTNADGKTSKLVVLRSVAAQADHALPLGPEITPQRLAVDGIGRFYVTDEMSRFVMIINALGQTLKTIAIEGRPSCVAPAPFSQLFIGDRARRRVDLYNGLGKRLRSMGGPTERMTPTALVADGLGKLYAADGATAKIHVFDIATGGTLKVFSLPTGTLPVGLALSGGKLYIADAHRGQVLVRDAVSGIAVATVGALGGKDGQLMAPSGVAVGANGWVFALDAYQARISVFDGAGTFLTHVASFGSGRGQLKVPLGLVRDAFGRLVVASSSNRRLEFLRLNGATSVVCLGDKDCDGMPDAWEAQYGLANNKATDAYQDADGDGLSNVEEKARGTDPTRADTDGDGVSDGDEVNAGKNPLDASDQRPVARVFPPYSTEPTLLALDGQLSSDPNQDALKYRWRQLDGPETLALTKPDSLVAGAVAKKAGKYRFELTVNDGKIDSAPAVLEITVLQVAPTADAGPDLGARAQGSVRLDGRFSSDANGDALTFAWKQLAGPTVTLSDDTTARPTFVAAATGLYTFELTVSDGQASSSDRVHVRVGAHDDHLPVAAANKPAAATVGSKVELDASASVDSDGDKLTYRWKQLAGPAATLTGDQEKLATFVPAAVGVYRFALTVNDGKHDSVPHAIDVVVGMAPRAAANFDQRVEVLQKVSLSCAGSTAVDEEPDCRWKQVEGIHVPLRTVSGLAMTFVPIESGTYVFELSVAANDVDGTRDRVTVVVDDPAVNTVPQPLVETKPPHYVGQTVLLDATKSKDPDASALLGYSWTQVAGPHVILTRSGATASFVPPLPATYAFELRADDGTDRSPGERVEVPVAKPGDKPPIADVGPDQLVLPGAEATADGSASSDPEGRPLTFRWRQTGGPTDATVEGLESATLRLRPVASGYTLRFALTVNDGVLDSTPGTLNLSVVDAPLILRRVTAAATVLRVDLPDHPQHGLQIDVDADTFSEPLWLAVGEITRAWYRDARHERYHSAVFIGPVGSIFDKPLRIALPLDVEWLKKRGVTAAEVGLARFDHDADAWQPVEGIDVDLAAGVLRTTLAKPAVLQITLPPGASRRVTGGGGCTLVGDAHPGDADLGAPLLALLLLALYGGWRRRSRGCVARVGLSVAILFGLLAGSSPAGATDGPHDIAAGRFTQGCVECHTSHSAPDLSGNGNYYNPGLIKEPQGVANLCTVCHANKTGITWNIDPATGDEAVPGTKGSSHSWSGAAVNTTYQTKLPTDNAMLLRLTNTNNLSCITCHDPHSQSKLALGPTNTSVNGIAGWGNKLQRVDNDTSQLCFDCHRDRKVASTKTWRDPATNPPFSHPVERGLPTSSSIYYAVPREPSGTSQADAIYGNATTGSTASVLRDSSASWGNLANYWVRMKSGANRGLARQIAAGNTATQITLQSAFPSAIAVNDSYEIDLDGNTTNNYVLSNATPQAGCGTNCGAGTHNQQTTGNCVTDSSCPGSCQGASQCDATRGFPVCTCATASAQTRYAYNSGACNACFGAGFGSNFPTCTPTSCASVGQACGHGTCVAVSCGTNPCLPAAEHPLEATGACTANLTCTGTECNSVVGACKANPNGDDVHCDCPVGYTGGDCSTCAPGFSGAPCASNTCATDGQACGYGSCVTAPSGRESIVCANASLGDNPKCVSVNCSNNDANLGNGQVGDDCAREAQQGQSRTLTFSSTFTTTTTGPFAVWLRVYADDSNEAGENYSCTIDGAGFSFTTAGFNGNNYNPNNGVCSNGFTGKYCWAAAGGFSGGQANGYTLNPGNHTLSCSISVSNGDGGSEMIGFDGIYVDTDRSFVPSDSTGSCNTSTTYDTWMTRGGLSPWPTNYCGSSPNQWLNRSGTDPREQIVMSNDAFNVTNQGSWSANYPVTGANESVPGNGQDVFRSSGNDSGGVAPDSQNLRLQVTTQGSNLTYHVWVAIRRDGTSCSPELRTYIDNTEEPPARITSLPTSFQWVDLGTRTLNAGNHNVEFRCNNDCSSTRCQIDGFMLTTEGTNPNSDAAFLPYTTSNWDDASLDFYIANPVGGLACSCQTGYTGAACDQCDTGYTARNGKCVNTDPCAGNTCSGHGTCYVDANDQAACDCSGAYWGPTCNNCSSFSCNCETGYTGTNCDQCATGYVIVAGTCQADPCASQTCDGNGSCYVASDGTGACQCTQRFFNSTNPLSCSQCTTTTGTASGSYTQGSVTCQTCHGVHYADSNSSTYDDRPRAGDGNLLRRTNDAQACTSCHNLPGHQGKTCKDCHDTHNTYNVFLFKKQIVTANRGTVTVDFRAYNPPVQPYGSIDTHTGSPSGNGPCEVCHTTTAYYKNTGGAASHNTACRCTDCHTHASGFAVPAGGNESVGGANCTNCCHSDNAGRMNGTTATNPGGQTIVTRHTMGTAESVGNPDNNNPPATWTNPDAVPQGNRSCTNMCHPDHTHTPTHAHNVYNDATDATSRSTGGTAKTDFDNSQANGGLCISCHKSPITVTNATFGTQVHVAISKTKYAGSAHDSTQGTYRQHDLSTFDRNCTKCHADSADESPTDTTTPFGAVHFSPYDALLYRDFRGSAGANLLCYLSGCHSAGTTRDVQAVFAKANAHPVASDTKHDSHTEATATYNSGAFKGASRHVNCLDCHNAHEAGKVLHNIGSNAIAADSPLQGATGVVYTPPSTMFAAPTAGNYSTNPVAATKEYEICFKCHSSFAFGGTAPTNQTDVAQEFNPNNNSYHPVVQALPTTDPGGASGGSSRLDASQLNNGWTPGMLMTCSDCHGSDANSSGAQGPHGSAAQFILKGPNTRWPTNASGIPYALSGGPATTGLFCLNCHPLNSGGWKNNVHDEHGGRQAVSNVLCVNCHILVPHGSKLSRLMGDRDGPVRYLYQGNPNNMAISRFRKMSRNSYQKADCYTPINVGSGDGCTGTHGSSSNGDENW